MSDAQGGRPQDTPPSFMPAASRRRQNAATAGSGQTVPPSYTPAPARAARSSQSSRASQASPAAQPSQPRSFTPRRSSGSTRVANPAGSVSSPTHVMATDASAHAVPPLANGSSHGRSGVMATSARKHHRVRNGIIATLVILFLALGMGLFGAWHWVDSRLVKEDWLSSAASTSGTTWLVLGSDERDGSVGGSPDDTPGFRTDTILVLTKPKQGPSSLISIPRDSLTKVDGQYMKINAIAQLAGPKALVEQVEQITGRKIDHVAKIKFGGLKQVVDALGGIELCYDQNVSDPNSGLEWQAGCHVADGGTALAFSRMRYADANGDFGRNERQRQVIGAIMKKGLSRSTLTNWSTVMSVADTALEAVSFDEKTNPWTLATMALAFRDAMGEDGVNGSVYWTDPNYMVRGVGSTVLLDDARNTELFSKLADGGIQPGTVGTLAENQQ